MNDDYTLVCWLPGSTISGVDWKVGNVHEKPKETVATRDVIHISALPVASTFVLPVTSTLCKCHIPIWLSTSYSSCMVDGPGTPCWKWQHFLSNQGHYALSLILASSSCWLAVSYAISTGRELPWVKLHSRLLEPTWHRMLNVIMLHHCIWNLRSTKTDLLVAWLYHFRFVIQ